MELSMHFCPECANYWPCVAIPCETPKIAPCGLFGCGLDWRDVQVVEGQTWPDEQAMLRNIFPSTNFDPPYRTPPW